MEAPLHKEGAMEAILLLMQALSLPPQMTVLPAIFTALLLVYLVEIDGVVDLAVQSLARDSSSTSTTTTTTTTRKPSGRRNATSAKALSGHMFKVNYLSAFFKVPLF